MSLKMTITTLIMNVATNLRVGTVIPFSANVTNTNSEKSNTTFLLSCSDLCFFKNCIVVEVIYLHNRFKIKL